MVKTNCNKTPKKCVLAEWFKTLHDQNWFRQDFEELLEFREEWSTILADRKWTQGDQGRVVQNNNPKWLEENVVEQDS